MAVPVVEVATSEQLRELKVPVELLEKRILPVGVMSVLTSVSVTVAVHTVFEFPPTVPGEQTMRVEVARLSTTISLVFSFL